MKLIKRTLSIIILKNIYGNPKLIYESFVYGEEDFKIEINNVLLFINKIDATIAKCYYNNPWLIFQSSVNKDMLDLATPFAGISSRWINWGVEGIAAYLIYAGSLKKLMVDNPKTHLKILRKNSKNYTKELLKKNNFPTELINCYN